MGDVTVLQHLDAEAPAQIRRVLEEQGHRISIIRSDRDQLPSELPPGCHSLVVMGGPMGVYEDDRYAWIAPEMELIRSALDRGLPLMGVCMGSQLMAAAAGARVYPGGRPQEIGWDTVRLTPAGLADPLCRHLARADGPHEAAAGGADSPGEATVFQWHGDTFDLPGGAELLASSALYPRQAFRIGHCAYAFQFHFELGTDDISHWLDLWPDALLAEGVEARAVREQTAVHMKSYTARGRALIGAFGKLVENSALSVSA